MPRTIPGLHYSKRRGYYTYEEGERKTFGQDPLEAQTRYGEFLAAKPLPGNPETVSEAVAAWLAEHPGTWHRDMANLYDGWAGDLALRTLPVDHWLDLAKHFRPDYSPQTIKHVLSHAQRILKLALSKGWVERLPRDLERREHPKVVRKPKDVSPGRVKALFADLDSSGRTKRTAAICRFITTVGCRPEEACSLTWENVDLEAGTCLLTEHKTADVTGQTRTIYLTLQAHAILEAQRTRWGIVFLNLRNRPFKPGSIRSVLRRRGLTGAYQLRHTFAQQALDQLSMEDVSKLLGHQDLRMVQTYAQVRDPRAKAAARKLSLPVPTEPAAGSTDRAGGSAAGPGTPTRSKRRPADDSDGTSSRKRKAV